VVVAGRKLVGSAQLREAGVILQHGSLLLADDQGTVHRLLRTPVGPTDDQQHPATLAGMLEPLPEWDALVAALATGFREELAMELLPTSLTVAERDDIVRRSGRFQDPAWTWRY
jgi:lipoyl(octanoyl) transferase